MIEPQRLMLGDAVRNHALHDALRTAVAPGRTRVADIGTGTGFLAILAAKLGARSVWACEHEPGLLALARTVAKANGCTAIRFAGGHSTELAPPQPVDLIIAEVLGNLATDEHLCETLADARRFLAPGGRVIPRRVLQYACPVTADRLQRAIDVWPGIGHGVDLAAARTVSLNNFYVRSIEASDCLHGAAAAQVWEDLALPGPHPARRRGGAQWRMDAGATIHGFALWWRAELVDGIDLSTDPRQPPTHWQQVYLPLTAPLAARAGDGLHLDLGTETPLGGGCVLRWSGHLQRGGRPLARFAHDNRKGFI